VNNLKLSNLSATGPVDVDGRVLSNLSPVVHDQLIGLTDVEGEVVVLAPHCQVSASDQVYHRCVVGKLNDGVGVVRGHAVLDEQGVQVRIKQAALKGPGVEGQCGRGVVAYPHHLGPACQKSRIQLQREEFSLRVPSLIMSLKGTMVLNSEL
jgi:hypothetical protein